MKYLFFISIVTFGLYALVTGPRQIEQSINAPVSGQEQIRRMDEINMSFARAERSPASRDEVQ